MNPRRIEVSLNGEYVSDVFTTGWGQEINGVHPASRCVGAYCVIHRPWPGPWATWYTFWDESTKVMCRVCYHKVVHPAAEHYLTTPPQMLEHECCGCPCAPSAAQISEAKRSRRGTVIDGEVVEATLEIETR